LMNRAMNGEIAANKLADVTVTVKPLPLTAAQLQALGRLPNVAAFDPRSTLGTYVYMGPRTVLIGKASFAHQTAGRRRGDDRLGAGSGCSSDRRTECRLWT
jgi:hypothetical protein